MPRPYLTASQREALTKVHEGQQTLKKSLASAVTDNAAALTKAQDLDTIYKDLYYWHESIIKAYDSERKQLNGTYITGYIEEATFDAYAAGTSDSEGMTPSFPNTKPVRVSKFDGPTASLGTDDNETFIIKSGCQMEVFEGYLRTGFTATGTIGTGAYIASAVTASVGVDATLDIRSSTATTLSAGNRIIVTNGFIGTVKTVTVVSSVNPFRYTVVVTPITAGTGAANATVGNSFSGFTNTERTSSTAATNQSILTSLKTQYLAAMQVWIDKLTQVITAVSGNEDPDLPATVLSGLNTLKTNVTNMKASSSSLSDTSITTTIGYRSSRNTAITSRVTQIGTSLTTQFGKRYDLAVLRVDTVTGSLKTVKAIQSSTTRLGEQIDKAQGMIDSVATLFSNVI